MYVKKLERRIKSGSKMIDEYLSLGDLYFKAGNYKKLIELYNQAIDLELSKLDRARINYEKGEALQLLNKPDEAIVCFQEAINSSENEQDTWELLYIKGLSYYNLYLLCMDINEIEQHIINSEKYLNMLIKRYPENDEIGYVYSPLAEIYTKKGEYDKAIDCYKIALNQRGDNYSKVLYLSGLGSVYGMKKQYDLAEKYFKEALESSDNVKTSRIYYDMGIMYFEKNDLVNAIQAFRSALEKINKEPFLRNNNEYRIDLFWYIGIISYELGSYKDDVVKYLNALLELIDRDHYYYTSTNLTLGHLFSMSKNFGEAREYYNNVLIAPLSNDEDIRMANECLSKLPFDA